VTRPFPKTLWWNRDAICELDFERIDLVVARAPWRVLAPRRQRGVSASTSGVNATGSQRSYTATDIWIGFP